MSVGGDHAGHDGNEGVPGQADDHDGSDSVCVEERQRERVGRCARAEMVRDSDFAEEARPHRKERRDGERGDRPAHPCGASGLRPTASIV